MQQIVLVAITVLMSGCATIAQSVNLETSSATPALEINDYSRLQQEAEQAFNKSEYAKAEALFRRLLAHQERMLGAEHIETIRSIFYLGASLDAQGKSADTALLDRRSLSVSLLHAINEGDTGRSLMLLKQGANSNACNPRGFSALMYAGRVVHDILLSG